MWAKRVALLLTAILCVPAPAPANGDAPRPPVAAEVSAARLPAEARQTIALIRKGGPFPHDRDGIVFGNFEKRLPAQARGYYREYTVRTPGESSRGARRIVAGKGGE